MQMFNNTVQMQRRRSQYRYNQSSTKPPTHNSLEVLSGYSVYFGAAGAVNHSLSAFYRGSHQKTPAGTNI